MGVTVALCSGYLEQDVGSLIQKQRGDADYVRWKKQNEFDGALGALFDDIRSRCGCNRVYVFFQRDK